MIEAFRLSIFLNFWRISSDNDLFTAIVAEQIKL